MITEDVLSTGAAPDALPHRFSDAVVILSQPGSSQAEAIGDLRTHLLAQHVSDTRRSLTICSPAANAGATFIATNLAVAFALAGVRTLLIDSNMRQPGLETMVAPGAPRPGLRQCLMGEASLADAIDQDVIPQLSLLYSGGTTESVQDLLSSNRFKTLVDDCVRNFDLTIVDTAPSNASADARRVANMMRFALIVVRRNMTYLSDVRTLVEELQADRVNIIGTFLNDV